MPWLLVLQIGLLVAWYTVLPLLPVWVVFLPTMIGIFGFAIWLVAVSVGLAVATKR